MTYRNDRPLRLDLIVRTSKRRKEARSPQQQRDMAEACAQSHGYEIVRTHDSGASESGKTMDRASVRDAMERVRTGATDGVIVALTDRLGRAPIEEAMTVVRELDKIGYLVLADAGGQPVDLAEPMAETNLVLQLQMARQFWLTTANRFKRSQRDAIAAGKFVGPTPLGYERDGGRLYEHPEQGPAIREAYRRAARGGLHAAADHLEDTLPGRRWDTDRVRRLLNSRTYLGESRTGELVNREAHAPLTTLADWTAAQTEPQARRANGTYPASGLVTCATCGSPMVGAAMRVRGVSYRRMRCNDPSCRPGASISADRLESYLREQLAAALESRYLSSASPAGLDEALVALETAEADRRRWAEDDRGRDLMGEDVWLAGLVSRKDRVDAAHESYRVLAARAAEVEELPTPEELHDGELFARALRALTGRATVSVRPGRGRVEERVSIVARRGDHPARVLAA